MGAILRPAAAQGLGSAVLAVLAEDGGRERKPSPPAPITTRRASASDNPRHVSPLRMPVQEAGTVTFARGTRTPQRVCQEVLADVGSLLRPSNCLHPLGRRRLQLVQCRQGLTVPHLVEHLVDRGPLLRRQAY